MLLVSISMNLLVPKIEMEYAESSQEFGLAS